MLEDGTAFLLDGNTEIDGTLLVGAEVEVAALESETGLIAVEVKEEEEDEEEEEDDGNGGGDVVDDEPVADSQEVQSSINTPVEITLTGSDTETCELTFSIVQGPANGILSGISDASCTEGDPNTDSATLTYTPNADFVGEDSFIFQVNDGTQDSDEETVEIIIVEA